MITILGFLVTSLTRYLLLKYRIGIPHTVFTLVLGFFCGFATHHIPEIRKYIYSMNILPSYDMLYLFAPILVFHLAFCMDMHSFYRTLSQILIVSLPVSLLTGWILGMILVVTIDTELPFWSGILFGLLTTPIYTPYVVHFLKEFTINTKHIVNLLEGETLISTGFVAHFNLVLIHYQSAFAEQWYELIWLYLRAIVTAVPLGYVFGLIGRMLLRKTSLEPKALIGITLGFPCLIYAFSVNYFKADGAVTVIIFGCMLAIERATIWERMNHLLLNLLSELAVIADMIICLRASFLTATGIYGSVEPKDVVFILVTYFMYYITRFMCFLLFSPILTRLGSGISFKMMLFCVWSGTKSPYALLFPIMNYTERYLPEYDASIMCLQISGLHFLSLLINGGLTPVILRMLGLADISLARHVNMQRCVTNIFKMRTQTINVLKMTKFLGAANWTIVKEVTEMKNPYTETSDSIDEDLSWNVEYQFTECPECHTDIPHKPTTRQMKEMIKEANMRILKVKKISYIRQYENGMMSYESIRILTQAVEIAMDTTEAIIPIDGLCERFNEEKFRDRFWRRNIHRLLPTNRQNIIPPRLQGRRLCYNLVTNSSFQIFMYILVVLNVVLIVVHIITLSQYGDRAQTSDFDVIYVFLTSCFCLAYWIEFIMRIMAYSWNRIGRNGFRTYFKYVWNVIDFVVLCLASTELIITLYFEISEKPNYWLNYLLWIGFTHILKLFRIFGEFQPMFARRLESHVDHRMAFTYELGKCYVSGEDEVVEILPYLIDNEQIRAQIKQKIDEDRQTIIKLLSKVQKEKPWIAITVKTKQAIGTILHAMMEAIEYLKVNGWADDFEATKLFAALRELEKKVGFIQSVPPSAPKIIFREVAWMVGDKDVIQFLFENVTVKKFDCDTVIFEEGNVAEGIYIVVNGLLRISYTPDEHVLDSLKNFGCLPIVDYMSCSEYKEPLVDYIVPGNCIGELSFLTGRAYNCSVVATINTQVYVLSNGIIRRAMIDLSPDPINGLESRIWKAVGIRTAIPILLSIPAYESSPQKVKYALERSFVPNLSQFKMFVINSVVQDIILVEGVVSDLHTRDIFTAPCSIPRTIQTLILPKSSLMDIPIDLDAKMLIVPDPSVIECYIESEDGNVCELKSEAKETKCLQHFVRNRHKSIKKKYKPRKRSEESTSVDPSEYDLHKEQSGSSSKLNITN